jgi:uncharacterized protein (TIGR00369 family)
MTRILVNDSPENGCFGCSPSNPAGLQLQFHEQAPGLIETPYTAPEHVCGAPGVIHGGIQATLLDEALGMAIHSKYADERIVVTVDFKLRYRRPAPTGTPLILRARHLRAEGRDHYLEGEILDADGKVLTRAEARWCEIPDTRPKASA